jgi:cytosine/uracil/thiamine/allantoin permease
VLLFHPHSLLYSCGQSSLLKGKLPSTGPGDKDTLHFYRLSANTEYSGGPLIRGKLDITSSYMNTAYSALTGLNVIIGLFSSLAVNMPDFGRFSKNKLAGPHQFLALPIIGTLGALTPIFVTDAHSYIWGEFEWYVIVVGCPFAN